jgi:CBS domain containing-hemolysin-like protein
MVVNVLFFAISSVLVIRFKSRGGLILALATAVISFVALVLLGEIVPKSLTYKNSRILSVFAALPIYFYIRLFAPLTPDSLRFWPADKNESGRNQESFDKQFVRNYLEEINFDNSGQGIELPVDIIQKQTPRILGPTKN